MQALGDAELAIKQQAVVVAVKFKMQRKANSPQHMLALIQFVALGFGEKTETYHFAQGCRAEVASSHPLQGMDIPQAAGAAFNIGFEVITGAVVALMALLLFSDFGSEKTLRRPETLRKNVLMEFEKQRHVAGQQPRFNQIGGDSQIG